MLIIYIDNELFNLVIFGVFVMRFIDDKNTKNTETLQKS